MTRLHSEFARLYLPDPAAAADRAPTAADLVDASGRVRALVLELHAPAEWEPLRAVWRGVQTDLDLPAPAIAVNGVDGLQLWFSLARAVTVAQAHDVLAALWRRYLPSVPLHRLRLWPSADDAAPAAQVLRAACVPAPQPGGERWSAFVAPDLAPIFTETPWIDVEPSDQGQAGLLERVASIQPEALAASLAQLAPPVPAAQLGMAAPLAADAVATSHAAGGHRAAGQGLLSPQAFLMRVMNDENAPLALRIEAAKALLPYQGSGRRGDAPAASADT
ncbi:hypothetical protein [Aquabacterium sp.]|uniref:hypothetical protein n=1 Tax=Aquabacterium sp. TaxID=1872578 RepID=UPI002B5EDCFF|nr:hypothetical protein [Aquabacterium sp.]HSW05082.1 hypothetical protein [Aquabacterium sp.]